jgi:hypothetical protein
VNSNIEKGWSTRRAENVLANRLVDVPTNVSIPPIIAVYESGRRSLEGDT